MIATSGPDAPTSSIALYILVSFDKRHQGAAKQMGR